MHALKKKRLTFADSYPDLSPQRQAQVEQLSTLILNLSGVFIKVRKAKAS